MTHDERVQKLRNMLTHVAGPNGLESMALPVQAGGYETIPEGDPVRDAAANALRKLQTGAPLSPLEAFGLEAIVLPDKRPVVFVKNNVFDLVPMDEWAHLNKPEIHSRLDPLFPSIGRVELPNNSDIPYAGTGFVVGDGLLMTNRHVARIFTDGLGMHLRYHTGGSAVDFKREDGVPASDTSARVKVTDVVMIHPYWDMALLKVDGLPDSAKPLKLAVTAPEDLVGKDVVVVGYPARDYRNDLEVQDRVFQRKYGVKRMQPGKAQKRERIRSFENDVDAMTHDSSTLGGNSGSAMIDVASGTVVGLHFAGEYLKANYAVPTYELARDQRVVDARLNFQGSVAATTLWASSWAFADSHPEKTVPPVPPAGPVAPVPVPAVPAAPLPPTLVQAAGTTVSFLLPVTLAIGAPIPVAGSATLVPGTPPAGAPEAESSIEKVPKIYPDLSLRKGYQNDFLHFEDGQTVPLPQLTSAGKALAAKLEDGSTVLNYHKFSLVMHKKRRLALFTAANVDWRDEKRKIDGRKPTRKELDGFTGNEKEDWVVDPRIPLDHQIPDYFYRKGGGAFDRGHLVRRDDVAWGDSFEDMQQGNGDTFHTTNCSPQTAEFNRAKPSEFNWGALENLIQKQTRTEQVCIFSGPVLAEDDRYFHGLVKSGVAVSIQIPSRFWKIIVANNDGKPAAFGFVLDQDLSDVDLHAELAIPNGWKKFMRPIAEIEGYLQGLAKLTWFKNQDQYKAK
jgi:endonuclease G